MAEQQKPFKKQFLIWNTTDATQANNWIKHYLKKISFNYIRTRSFKSRVHLPIVVKLREGTNPGIIQIFNTHIDTLIKIERFWKDFMNVWLDLVNYYVGMGFHNTKHVKSIIPMIKFGSRPTIADLVKYEIEEKKKRRTKRRRKSAKR